MVQPSSPIVEYIDQSGNLVMSRDILQEVRPVGGRAISYGSKNGLNKYKRLQPISTNNMSYNKVIFPEKQALKTGLGEKTESEKQVFENTTGKFVISNLLLIKIIKFIIMIRNWTEILFLKTYFVFTLHFPYY